MSSARDTTQTILKTLKILRMRKRMVRNLLTHLNLMEGVFRVNSNLSHPECDQSGEPLLLKTKE